MSPRGKKFIPALGSAELAVTELEVAGGALGLCLLCCSTPTLNNSQVRPPWHSQEFEGPGLCRALSQGGKHSPGTCGDGDTGTGTALGLPWAPLWQEEFGSSWGVPAPLSPVVTLQLHSGRDSKWRQLCQDEDRHLWLLKVL